jgi:hypothetical protein
MRIIGIKGLGELEIKNVSIENLFLDPNNPRFMDVESKTRTPFSKYKKSLEIR